MRENRVRILHRVAETASAARGAVHLVRKKAMQSLQALVCLSQGVRLCQVWKRDTVSRDTRERGTRENVYV